MSSSATGCVSDVEDSGGGDVKGAKRLRDRQSHIRLVGSECGGPGIRTLDANANELFSWIDSEFMQVSWGFLFDSLTVSMKEEGAISLFSHLALLPVFKLANNGKFTHMTVLHLTQLVQQS
jgi:hypothetical protein